MKIIKNVSKKIIQSLVKLFHNVVDYKLIELLKVYLNSIYSYWIQHEFKEAKHVYFNYPLLLKGGNYITVGNGTFFGKNNILTAWNYYKNIHYNPIIEIGNNCCFGEYNHITSINGIYIGDNVLTGRWVTITDNSHGKTDIESLILSPINRKLYSEGKVIIGNNVWIGDKVTILPNVRIGESAIIAANSVVTKDVPPFTVVAGNPANVIKKYNYVKI